MVAAKPDRVRPQASAEVQRILKARAFTADPDAGDKNAHLRYAVQHVELDGLWLEFGVSTGGSLTVIAEQTHAHVYGFDWFDGLPEEWVRGDRSSTLPRGTFSGRPSAVPSNVTLVDGLFEQTLARFIEEHHEPVAFMHVDCDLYASTATVFASLHDRIVPGTIIVFDELFGYGNFAEHEMKALFEAVVAYGLVYDYLGWAKTHVPDTSCAASLRITAAAHHE